MSIILKTFSIYLLLLIPAAAIAVILKPRDRWWTARMFLYLLLLFMLTGPLVTFRQDSERKAVVGLFIDTSASMSIGERWNRTEEVCSRVISELGRTADLYIYEFGDSVKKIDTDKMKALKPQSCSTDISAVIEQKGFDGKILITDGRYNAGRNPLSVAGLSLTPVLCIGMGGGKNVPDIGISDLMTPGIGFRSQEVTLQFSLINESLLKGRTTVYLKESDEILARKEVLLEGRKKTDVTISFIPNEVGLKNYTVVIEQAAGEMNLTNNSRNFQLKINRQKIRILYVSGQPSWEYSFFRRLVRSDPQIDLVTFLILRNPENITVVPEYELSLIQFPAREMFTDKIYEFDLLIYENFSYKKFFPKSYLTHIKDFVIKGGGFIMLGGDDSFSRGGYNDTPISEILPVELSGVNSEWVNKRIKIHPAQSADHPVLYLADDAVTSREVWESMPELEGYDNGLKLKADATLLLKTADGIPVLAVSNSGKGRAMAFNSNTTWMWCMGLAEKGKTPFYYNRFWYKLIRYMVQSGDLKNIQVFPGTDRAKTGDMMGINIKVLDRYWQPVDIAQVKMNIRLPSGEKVPLGIAEPVGSKGWYYSRVPVKYEGIYEVTASAYVEDVFLGKGEAVFSGVELNREISETSLNKQMLESIAEISGGYYRTGTEIKNGNIPEEFRAKLEKETVLKTFSWDYPLLYLIIIFILLLEWYIRRKAGLV
ncbi:MAG: glutamine amidotransferase [Elusimicrobiota bacterium]